jgi:hypothetical protein
MNTNRIARIHRRRMLVKAKDAGQGESRRHDRRRLRNTRCVGLVCPVDPFDGDHGRSRAGVAPASAAASASSTAASAAGSAAASLAAAASASTAASAASTAAAAASVAASASSAAAAAAVAAAASVAAAAAAAAAAPALTNSAAATAAAAAVAGARAAAASAAAGLAASAAAASCVDPAASAAACAGRHEPATRAIARNYDYDHDDDVSNGPYRHHVPRAWNADGFVHLLTVAVERRLERRIVGSGRSHRASRRGNDVGRIPDQSVRGTADLPAGR